MYIYMGHLRPQDTQPYEPQFWKKNRIELLKAHVQQIDTTRKSLLLDNNTNIGYDKLILATGSKTNKFGWPGQDLKQVSGLYTLQDLDAMEAASKNMKRAVIVGGGLIGIEMAEMFHSRKISVTMLVREQSYWNNILPEQESQMINRHIQEHGIDLRLETELKEIVDDGTGTACAIITKTGEKIQCQYVGLTAGVSPNIDLVKNTQIETNRGILVNNYLETNIPGIYAIGDCAEHRTPKPSRRSIEAIWYTGRMAGEVCAYNICGIPVEYYPGIWFNSAKFLDIEYQVYGNVPTQLTDQQDTLYWEHQSGKKSIRIVYDKISMTVIGFNLMGVRYRHEICENWIRQYAHIEEVLQHLAAANFDPEFFRTYEKEVIAMYNQQMGRNIQPLSTSSLKSVNKLLSNARIRMGKIEKFNP
jgi:NAD(P)H-nitrite reductase large subunit